MEWKMKYIHETDQQTKLLLLMVSEITMPRLTEKERTQIKMPNKKSEHKYTHSRGVWNKIIAWSMLAIHLYLKWSNFSKKYQNWLIRNRKLQGSIKINKVQSVVSNNPVKKTANPNHFIGWFCKA